MAIDQAVRAGARGEVPVGAIVVAGDSVLGAAGNAREELRRSDRTRGDPRSQAGRDRLAVVAPWRGDSLRDAGAVPDVRRRARSGPGGPPGIRGCRPQGGLLRISLQPLRRSSPQPRAPGPRRRPLRRVLVASELLVLGAAVVRSFRLPGRWLAGGGSRNPRQSGTQEPCGTRSLMGERLQELVDGRRYSVLTPEEDDLAVEVVALDPAGGPLEALPA